MRAFWTLAAFAGLLSTAPQTWAQHQAGHTHGEAAADTLPEAGQAGGHAHGSHDATVRHRFIDAERWSEVFDDPGRDRWQRPQALVDALDLDTGAVVADLGAGTGYFVRYLARAVGERGAVYAVDVEPTLIEHLRRRAEREQLGNVIPVLGSFDNPRLPAGQLDLILIVNTYHHIDARPDYFGDLRSRLKGGGRLVVVDYHSGELPVGPPPDHKLAPERVVEELTLAGYRLLRQPQLLPYQYVLVFEPRG